MKKKRPTKNKKVTTQVSNRKYSNFLFLLPILIIGFISFLPALECEFVNWDDDKNFYENELITSLNSSNFFQNSKEIFKTKVIGNYNPLTIFSFALEKHFFGLDKPFYWHLNNLLLHLISVIFVFLIGKQLKLNNLSASLLALLFAVHPMRVESVVWVTERKDVLFASFYFASIYQYIKYKYDAKKIRWLWIVAFFILSLFSKIQAVVLPLSLILIDYYLEDKFKWKHVFSKIPLLIISLVFGLLAIYFLQSHGSLESNSGYSIIDRFFIGSYSFIVYIIKSIIPYRLSPLYPYPPILPWYITASIVIFPLYAFAGWIAHKKSYKYIVFGMGFFFFNIIFLLQILAAGQGFLADRFTYVAYFGFFFMIAKVFQKYSKGKHKKLSLGISIIAVVIYSLLSFFQSRIWTNSGTLWTHVLKYYDNSTLPYGNRANYYRDLGLNTLALRDYNSRIALRADDPDPFNSRAKLFFNSNNKDTLYLSVLDYSKAIELAPNAAEYYINRGAAHAKLNNPNKALADLDKGLEMDPNFVNGYLNRSVVYNNLGNLDLALRDALKFLEYRPYSADIWYQSGVLSQKLQNFSASIPLFNKAIELKNNNGMFYYQRSKSQFMTNNNVGAKQDFYTAKKLGYKVEPTYQEQINKI